MGVDHAWFAVGNESLDPQLLPLQVLCGQSGELQRHILGAIGGVVVLLVWFYVLSLAILVGAELNGVIEQAWRSFHGEPRTRTPDSPMTPEAAH
jgi:hypothetical protein